MLSFYLKLFIHLREMSQNFNRFLQFSKEKEEERSNKRIDELLREIEIIKEDSAALTQKYDKLILLMNQKEKLWG